MIFDFDEIRRFAIEASNSLRHKANESVLRHLFSSRLRLMFPDGSGWIRAHGEGAEAEVHFADSNGTRRKGLIDYLVGKTVIEYERNITSGAGYDEGFRQALGYCSALLNKGNSVEDIFGILSDTVHWRAFKPEVRLEPASGGLYGPDNIVLKQIDSVDLDDPDDRALDHFVRFIARYLGRKGSRPLDPRILAKDLGFQSVFYAGHIDKLKEVVDWAFEEKRYYSDMIANTWQNFVNIIENTKNKSFNRDDYTDKLYIITLLKIICANIFTESVILGGKAELINI